MQVLKPSHKDLTCDHPSSEETGGTSTDPLKSPLLTLNIGDDSSAGNLSTKVLSKICHEHEAQFKDFQPTNCLQSLTNKLFCAISLCEDSPIVDHHLSIYSSWEARLYPVYRITETTETVATGSSATCFSDAALLGACYRQEGQQGLKACIASAGKNKHRISKVEYIMRVLFWKKIGVPTFSFLVDALIFRSHDLPTWNFRTWMNAQIPRRHKPPSWVRSAFGGCEQKMTHEHMTNAGALLSFTTANIAFLTLFFLHPNKYIYRKGTSHQRTGVAPPTLWLFIGASTAFVAAFFTL